jgi:hypothetical protein
MRQFVSDDEAVDATCQHTTPCGDCPWTRESIPGWLGNGTVDEWIAMAHSEHEEGCHTLRGASCAGMAIYRANVCKSLRDPNALKLPRDKESVFGTLAEFREHHTLRFKP